MKKVRLFSLIVLMLPIILQISLRAKAAPDAPTISELPSQTLAPEEIISKRSTSDYELLAIYALAFDTSSLRHQPA